MRTPKPAFSCLTLDMGADSIRLMEVSLTGNGPRMREIHRFSNLHVIRNGFDCWDLDHIRSGIGKGLHLAREAGGIHPLSIGVDSWGVDTIWMEESGRVSAPPVSYRDQRTRDMPRLWAERMSEVETFRRTGIQSTAFNTLYQLLAQKLNGGWPDACRLLFIPSYINYLLSGHIHNELTIASTSQLLQARGRQWDEEILRLLDLEPGRLGEVIPPGTHLGPVRWPGAPHMETVAVCGHDTACVVAALPPEEEGRAFLVAGTWCILGVNAAARSHLTDAARNLGFTNERAYPDRCRVLKNLVGLWLVQGLRRSWMDEPT
ncbi:MAG: FGGY family carbohydrate kinase [Bacteroidales bacterium]